MVHPHSGLEKCKINVHRVKKQLNSERCPDCIVHGALGYTFRLSSLIGLAPVDFAKNSEGYRIRFSRSKCIVSVAGNLIINFVFMAGLYLDSKHAFGSHAESKVSSVIWVTDVVLAVLISNTGVFLAPNNMKKTIQYLNQLNSVIRKLNNGSLPQTSETRNRILVTMFLIFPVVMILSSNYVTLADSSLGMIIYLYVFYYVEWFEAVLLELQFTLPAAMVYSTLKTINQQILDLLICLELKDVDVKSFTSVYNDSTSIKMFSKINNYINVIDQINTRQHQPNETRTFKEKIRGITERFTAVCDVMTQINDVNGRALLLLLVVFLFGLVITPYNLFERFGRQPRNWILIIDQIGWLTFHLIQLLVLIEPGHRTEMEIEKTQMLLGRLMLQVTSPSDIATELTLFIKQIEFNKLTYSPMGMCVLNRPLIATILGSVTTYLVIIVQLQN